MSKQPEVWLRGPIPGLSPLLQPAAHAILQMQEEVHTLMEDFPSSLLWEKPAELASPAFHLQHIAGVLDRMMSYSKAEALSESQFEFLKAEGIENSQITTASLLGQLDHHIEKYVELLAKTDDSTLADYRPVGRAQLPSTVGGLLFHAAEHAQRHFGQLLVTVKVILLG